MGYVKTAEEVAELESYFSEPFFTLDALSCEFRTTEEFVRSVLPPCLEPAAEPVGEVVAASAQSRCCGEFGGAVVYVRARYGDLEGLYTLTMLISNDMPVTWGREVLGEVKKTANILTYRDGDSRLVYGERNGVRLIELEADFGPDEGPVEAESHAFELKAYPSANGKGLQYDPLLVIVNMKDHYTHTASGSGTLTLRGTPWDPLDTIPVLGIGPISYATGESVYRTVAMIPQADRDAYVPYVYGRHYDDFRLFEQPLRFKAKNVGFTAATPLAPVERVFVTA